MHIALRNYQPEDREQLIALFNRFQEYLVALDPFERLWHTPGYGEVMLSETLREVHEQRGKFTVATDGPVIVGFVAGVIQVRKNQLEVIDFTAGRITELYVAEVSRGQGVGTRLMEHIEAFFKSQGCDTAKIEVFAPNVVARRLYEKFGYAHRDIDNIKKL